MGHVQNIEVISVRNDSFREVLYIAKFCQLVVMPLKSNEDVGEKSALFTCRNSRPRLALNRCSVWTAWSMPCVSRASPRSLAATRACRSPARCSPTCLNAIQKAGAAPSNYVKSGATHTTVWFVPLMGSTSNLIARLQRQGQRAQRIQYPLH